MSYSIDYIHNAAAAWKLLDNVANHHAGEILCSVMDEVDRAAKLHPSWPSDAIHAAAIVAEESGELVRAALRFTYEGGSVDEIRTEAIHTAATAIRLLENLSEDALQ